MIRVSGITKKFEGQVVLDRLDLHVPKGEVAVLLGRNGAGKSTLLKCITGLYVPLEGSITIDGLDRRRDHLAIRRFTAWLPDQPALWTHLSGRAWLELVAGIYGVPEGEREEEIAEILDLFDLAALAGKKLATYSNGQYKKLALAATLVTRARLLVMDEPFTGEVDPAGVAALKEVLRVLRERRETTVLFSTQLVEQAEQVAGRVAILSDGRISDQGSAEELRARHRVASLEELLVKLSDAEAPGKRRFLARLRR